MIDNEITINADGVAMVRRGDLKPAPLDSIKKKDLVAIHNGKVYAFNFTFRSENYFCYADADEDFYTRLSGKIRLRYSKNELIVAGGETFYAGDDGGRDTAFLAITDALKRFVEMELAKIHELYIDDLGVGILKTSNGKSLSLDSIAETSLYTEESNLFSLQFFYNGEIHYCYASDCYAGDRFPHNYNYYSYIENARLEVMFKQKIITSSCGFAGATARESAILAVRYGMKKFVEITAEGMLTLIDIKRILEIGDNT